MKNSLSLLIKYMNKKQWLFLGYFSLILECLTPVIAALIQKDLIDEVFINKNFESFIHLIILYGIFFFGPKLWFTVRKVTFFHIGYHLQMNFTKAFINKMYTLSSKDFNKEHVGKLLNHVRNDISDACNIGVNQLLSESVKVIISIIFLSFSIAYISFLMLSVVVAVALIYYLLLKRFGEKTKKYAEKIREKKAHLSIAVEESVAAVREVVAFNNTDWQMKRFDMAFKNYFKAIIREGFYKIKTVFISEPFLYGSKLMVILFGGMSAINGYVSLGEFVISFTLADQLVTELGQLFQQGLTGRRFEASMNAIEVIMSKESVMYGPKNLDCIKTIEFKNVTFGYTDKQNPVIKELAMSIPVGKKVAFVGASGSGKSTIGKLLLREYKQDAGEILINGLPNHDYNESYTNMISVVFQEPYFLPKSIRENLLLGKSYGKTELDRVCEAMQCHPFISNFDKGYDTQVGERGVSLSGGQKQRLALARAMLKNTEVLILDEATSALDTETEFLVQKNIDQLRKGKTTIIIAHRLSTIKNADVIYVLDEGKVISYGTHEGLLRTCGIYNKLYTNNEILTQ